MKYFIIPIGGNSDLINSKFLAAGLQPVTALTNGVVIQYFFAIIVAIVIVIVIIVAITVVAVGGGGVVVVVFVTDVVFVGGR